MRVIFVMKITSPSPPQIKRRNYANKVFRFTCACNKMLRNSIFPPRYFPLNPVAFLFVSPVNNGRHIRSSRFRSFFRINTKNRDKSFSTILNDFVIVRCRRNFIESTCNFFWKKKKMKNVKIFIRLTYATRFIQNNTYVSNYCSFFFFFNQYAHTHHSRF